MRPSIARFSDMPGPQRAWNAWWGDRHGSITRQKGVIQYTLSPYQSKAAPQMIRTYMFNGFRRISAEAFYVVFPFAVGYGIYAWARSYDEYHNSKAGHVAAMAAGNHEEH
ncbi:cytochrome b-c1 complex subunit 8 [Mycena floridula]|nr:cytochrome b-c1 complex subunit 8 [Mycena floridula]